MLPGDDYPAGKNIYYDWYATAQGTVKNSAYRAEDGYRQK